MFDAPYALALTAGLLAAVNPCGFALLPAYLSLLVVGDRVDASGAGRLAAVGRALVLTAAMTVGFVAVFGVFGLLAAPAADAVARNLPWLSVVVGLVLAGLGGWLLAGRDLPAPTLKAGGGPAVTGRFWSMVAFGASYAVASLGCTVGPFLAVVASAFGTESVGAGVGLFVAYAAGMGLVVGIVALAVSLAKVSLVRGLRRAAPVISRVGGALLVVAGLYVAWYGGYELRVFSGASTTDPVIDGAGRIQSAISSWLGSLGPGALVVAFAVLLAATVTVAVLFGLRRAQVGPPDTGQDRDR
jgi:cytochrome c-type biogenesis protein